MATHADRIEWESPWTFGVILFVVYVVGQLLASWPFGGGLDITFVFGALGIAFVFAGVTTEYHLVITEHEYAS